MPERPNILFLLSDEHSFRFLSRRGQENGGEPCSTPNLDRLAGQGAYFDAAYCQMPLCTPSRMSMLTGRHSHRCGAWGNGAVLDPEIPTFASHLQEHGYDAATVGKMHLGGRLQHAGFSHRPYGDFGGPCGHQTDPLTGSSDHGDRPGMALRSRTLDAGVSQIPESLLQEQMVVRESLSWLREHRHSSVDQPWLLYASFSRPHFPLTAPRRFFERYWPAGVTSPRVGIEGDGMAHPMTVGAIKGFRTDEIGHDEMMKARAAYFACVDFLDEIIGDFLALLERDGLLENTVIVYTSDHGEIAGEHGLWWKNTWHEAATRVPLAISLPEHRAGTLAPAEVTAPASLADMFPTLCGLAAVPTPDGLDGIDLSAAIRGDGEGALESRPGVIVESLAPRWGKGTEFRMMRSRRYKYIAFRDCEDLAFDIQADPDEQRNLLAGHSGDEPPELLALRDAVLNGFSFDGAEETREREAKALRETYASRVRPVTPNQILLGDGRLVEADAPLYLSHVVSEDLTTDFSVT
jgi:choline-sulfatase